MPLRLLIDYYAADITPIRLLPHTPLSAAIAAAATPLYCRDVTPLIDYAAEIRRQLYDTLRYAMLLHFLSPQVCG